MFSVEMSIRGKVKGHVPWIFCHGWQIGYFVIHPIHRRLDPSHPNLQMHD
jgi:hypothetical protein